MSVPTHLSAVWQRRALFWTLAEINLGTRKGGLNRLFDYASLLGQENPRSSI